MNYVVGDIQGCFRALQALLRQINFDPAKDTLWSVGDLVARGEDSLSTLALLYDLGPNFKTVLGNHDLHLLSVANGVKKANPKDNLSSLLASPKLSIFVDWLRQFPLAQQLDKQTLICHAGLYPFWSFSKAICLSKEVENVLRSDNYVDFLSHMYAKQTSNWEKAKHSPYRLKFIVDAFTRMRYVDKNGHLDFSCKRAPSDAPKHLIPWYEMNNCKRLSNQRILFGHWASLVGNTGINNIVGLDTGFVWGGKLTCLCLETNQISFVSA
jgi:bis(5'-nucleosyl)-tetraphosphatase (symmetrical)